MQGEKRKKKSLLSLSTYSVLMPAAPFSLYLVLWSVDVNRTDDSKGFFGFVVEGPWLVHFCFQPVTYAAMLAFK